MPVQLKLLRETHRNHFLFSDYYLDHRFPQRDDWEEWLAGQRAEHVRLTAEIVRLETELNARVYELFDLNAAEIKIIEESTKTGPGLKPPG